MRMKGIRRRIREAIEEEQQSHRVAEALCGLALLVGRQPSPQEITRAVTFIREYVEHVPLLMEAGVEAAEEAGIGDEMQEVVGAVRQYWSEPNDLLPDRLGLLGVIDDAYYSLCLIQGVADRFQQQTGSALLPQNFTPANLAMRALIGEPGASMLDMHVASTLGQPSMLETILSMANAGAPTMAYQDPMWGNASMDEIVDAQLGSMGVVF
jgi:uncharacterized membrane protein YkvA (DUF1232 family)